MANEKLIDTSTLKYYHDNIASNTFVDKTSAQTINGVKTFTSPIYLTNSNFHIEKNSSSNVIDFTVNGTKVLTLGTSSSAINSVFRANGDNLRDLGTSTVRWKDVYVAGNLSDGTNSVSVANIAKTNVDNSFSTKQTFNNGIYTTSIDSGESSLTLGGTTGAVIVPYADDSLYLGANNKRWKRLYLSGDIRTGDGSNATVIGINEIGKVKSVNNTPPDANGNVSLTIPAAVTSINGLSGGELTSPLTLNGGDGASASKIIMSRTGAGQITDDSTSTLFGWTSANASTLTVGSNSYSINLRGSGTRPQYKGSDLALYSDLPTVPTNISAFTNDVGYITSSYHDSSKQDTLVSGTNIKTINGNSILGSGDLTISGGGSSGGFAHYAPILLQNAFGNGTGSKTYTANEVDGCTFVLVPVGTGGTFGFGGATSAKIGTTSSSNTTFYGIAYLTVQFSGLGASNDFSTVSGFLIYRSSATAGWTTATVTFNCTTKSERNPFSGNTMYVMDTVTIYTSGTNLIKVGATNASSIW